MCLNFYNALYEENAKEFRKLSIKNKIMFMIALNKEAKLLWLQKRKLTV